MLHPNMHRGSNRMANKREYFEPIWAEVHSSEFALMCFNYMAERKYDEANVMRAYDTKYKRDQKESNLSNVIKFIIHCIETRWYGIQYENKRITSTEMTNHYTAWCLTNRKVFSHPAFIAELKKIGIEAPKSLTVFGTKQRAFEIDEGAIRKALGEYLRQDEFKFEMDPLDNGGEGLEELEYRRRNEDEEAGIPIERSCGLPNLNSNHCASNSAFPNNKIIAAATAATAATPNRRPPKVTNHDIQKKIFSDSELGVPGVPGVP